MPKYGCRLNPYRHKRAGIDKIRISASANTGTCPAIYDIQQHCNPTKYSLSGVTQRPNKNGQRMKTLPVNMLKSQLSIIPLLLGRSVGYLQSIGFT